ncbi:MAG: tetratricopeptide repeat protein [Verrucomicrobiia bacterium]
MGRPQTKQLRTDADWLTLVKLLVGLTFIAYLPALRGGFVFDDGPLIIMNRLVRAHDGLYRFWFTTEASDYYPLTGSLWWLQWRVFGYHAIGYHAVNILLHTANAILVWVILLRLKIPGAWLAGLVFALHPVNAATVAWISEQKNTLSMLFSAVAILLYLRFYEDGRWRWYGFSLAAFLLALFSKTAVVMLPVVLLGCVWWVRGRLRWKDLVCSAPFFVFSLALGLVTIWFQHHRALQGHLVRSDGFPARLAAAGWVPWFYLYKTFLPVHLTLMYPKWSIDASRWVSYLPGALLFLCFLVFWRERRTWGRPLLFGLGYFVATLVPVLGFFDQGFYSYSLVADHWQYYSIVGVIALTVAAGEEVFRRIGDQHRWWGMAVAVGMLAMLGAATWQRGCVYASEETLWQDTVSKNPQAWRAYINLGAALKQAGKLEAAVGCFEQALRLQPDSAEAHNDLGDALRQQGQMPEAIRHFEQALRIRPQYAEPHGNLGNALAQLGRDQEAIRHFEQALQINPDFAEVHNNLGNALLRQGKIPEAIEHYQQALRIYPDFAEAHLNLAIALEKAGRAPEAIEQYQQALKLKPDLTEARYALTRLLGLRAVQ